MGECVSICGTTDMCYEHAEACDDEDEASEMEIKSTVFHGQSRRAK